MSNIVIFPRRVTSQMAKMPNIIDFLELVFNPLNLFPYRFVPQLESFMVQKFSFLALAVYERCEFGLFGSFDSCGSFGSLGSFGACG